MRAASVDGAEKGASEGANRDPTTNDSVVEGTLFDLPPFSSSSAQCSNHRCLSC